MLGSTPASSTSPCGARIGINVRRCLKRFLSVFSCGGAGAKKNGGSLPNRRFQPTQPNNQIPFWIMNLSRSATRQL